MSEELSGLQSLGAQKIYEQTHIPVQSVQAILHHSFEEFSKVQFLGFISILEREYKTQLPELRAEALAYFDANKEAENNGRLFIEPKKKRSFTTFYIFLALVIFIAVLTYSFNRTPEIPKTATKVDNTLIENVTKKIVTNEVNTTVDKNQTVVEKPVVEVKAPEVEEVPQKQKEVVLKSFEIRAKSKVWFGYIDTDTHKKYQKTFQGTMTLDPNKKWLLIFGHGYIDMYVNGKLKKFDSRDKVRFYYEDGELEAISLKQFKKLNRGRKW